MPKGAQHDTTKHHHSAHWSHHLSQLRKRQPTQAPQEGDLMMDEQFHPGQYVWVRCRILNDIDSDNEYQVEIPRGPHHFESSDTGTRAFIDPANITKIPPIPTDPDELERFLEA